MFGFTPILMLFILSSNLYVFLCISNSNDDAGTFGAVFIVFGLVGAGCVGKLELY